MSFPVFSTFSHGGVSGVFSGFCGFSWSLQVYADTGCFSQILGVIKRFD